MGRRTCRPGVVHKIERELISERTIAGLASARARGRSGDDVTVADVVAHARCVLAEPYLVRGHGGPMVSALRERIHAHIRERLDATAANLADVQRAELAAATAGAVWAALLWWLEDGRDLAPADAADASSHSSPLGSPKRNTPDPAISDHKRSSRSARVGGRHPS